MKTNEEPENIYLFENTITETPDNRWLSKRSDKNDIEYTRTDVFIEKACEWLKINVRKYAFVDTDKIGNVADIDLSFVQDFKEYTKWK